MHPSAMTTDKNPCRYLSRRQKYLQIPIVVSFRQQHLQRAILNAFWRVEAKVAAMKKEKKRLKKSHKKDIVKLRKMEATFTQLRAERMHALEEWARTRVRWYTVEDLLFAEAIGDFALADQLRASLRSLMK